MRNSRKLVKSQPLLRYKPRHSFAVSTLVTWFETITFPKPTASSILMILSEDNCFNIMYPPLRPQSNIVKAQHHYLVTKDSTKNSDTLPRRPKCDCSAVFRLIRNEAPIQGNRVSILKFAVLTLPHYGSGRNNRPKESLPTCTSQPFPGSAAQSRLYPEALRCSPRGTEWFDVDRQEPGAGKV